MIKITQEFETEGEAVRALNFNNQWASLYAMDEWLRSQIKHNVDLSDDGEEALFIARGKFHEIMESNGVDLRGIEL